MPDHPRVLVLGGTGLLGRHLLARLPASFPTVEAPRFDAADPAGVEPLVAAARPDVIVNAVGVKPPADAALMDAVNARFPIALARLAESRDARVIHLGTDAVFSGARGGYAEDDAPDPCDPYGRSKLAGEVGAPHLTLRTSFFGRSARGDGLIAWLAAQRGTIDGFDDYRFSGIAAAILADLIAEAIRLRLAGVYHVGGDGISKFDLLTAAAGRLGVAVTVRRAARGAVDRTLNSDRFFTAIGRRRPTLAESLEALSECGACTEP